MGRSAIYTDKTTISISSRNAKSKLQPDSERRAIVLAVLDNGGKMTVKELCDKFGYDIRGKISALINAGWFDAVTK